jgi:hypothetical protein
MNRALTYLWYSLLKRRVLHYVRGIRRPATLIGFLALAFFLFCLFRFRREEWRAQLVRPEVLSGGALIMLCGSLFKGFLQRGLVFQPSDVQFLFTSPFTQRQIVFYRLLPGYLFALAQSLVFFVLFAPHLKHPLLTSGCLMLLQIACFHVAAGAAIFGGMISEHAHHRIRWMLLSIYFVISALYLRAVLGLKLVPAFVSSSITQILFYPAVTISDFATAPPIGQWSLRLVKNSSIATDNLWQSVVCLSFFGLVALMSLWLLLRLKANIFETSLTTTTRVAERRLRLQQGRSLAIIEKDELRSASLPKGGLFRGVGAIVWKNFVIAFRSKRELTLTAVFSLIYIAFLVGLRWLFYHHISEGAEVSGRDIFDFDKIIGGMLCIQIFLLQRAFPFDFRRDGNHLVGFRTLPVTPFALALAELTVPTAFCLAFQAFGILVLLIFAHFDWAMALLSVVFFPAIVLALNGVWNLHYLLAAVKRAGGKAEFASPIALLMVVALSFLIFYPAGWTAMWVGRHTFGRFSEPLALSVGLTVQYAVDFLLVLTLAKLFQRFEVSHDIS